MTACGTPAYAAPEVLRNSAYSVSADVYSFAMVLWELITRQALYPGVLLFTTHLLMLVINDGFRCHPSRSSSQWGHKGQGQPCQGIVIQELPRSFRNAGLRIPLIVLPLLTLPTVSTNCLTNNLPFFFFSFFLFYIISSHFFISPPGSSPSVGGKN